jgi:hypothetical protein
MEFVEGDFGGVEYRVGRGAEYLYMTQSAVDSS